MCCLVGPVGEPVQSTHQNRVVGDGVAEQGLVRVVVRPCTFVPAKANDPFTLGYSFRTFFNQGDGRLFCLCSNETDPVNLFAQFKDMGVRVYKAREDSRASEVDHTACRVAKLKRVLAAAHKTDRFACEHNGLGIRVPAMLVMRC